MKKVLILLTFIVIFLASIGLGFFYLNTRTDQMKSSHTTENTVKNDIEYVSTEEREEMISPNAEIEQTIYYEKCGHSYTNKIDTTDELINLKEKEFKEKYKDWEINYFSSKKISIFKEYDEMCPEHYIIGESEGLVNIYRLNKDGEEELYETTNIFLSYLPEADQEKIRNKIQVVGMKNLNAVLENFD